MVTIAQPGLAERLRAGQRQDERGNLFDADCPTRLILDRIGDKWTVLLVILLSEGPMRFTELRTHLGRVAPKVLTQSLRRMERDGLVTREVFAEVPPRVEYELTELGRDLLAPIDAVRLWAEEHAARIVANRERHDSGPA